jgi:hypothetical protein
MFYICCTDIQYLPEDYQDGSKDVGDRTNFNISVFCGFIVWIVCIYYDSINDYNHKVQM